MVRDIPEEGMLEYKWPKQRGEERLPWQSSGKEPSLPLQETKVQSLLRELWSCMPWGVVKTKQIQMKSRTKSASHEEGASGANAPW